MPLKIAGRIQLVVATPRSWRCAWDESQDGWSRPRVVQLCAKGTDRKTSAYIGDRFPHRERRRSLGEKTGFGFGQRSLEGLKTDVAGIEAGVSSPVAYRWFRHAGGVNPSLPPTVSGRYLSFAEREDIAIWRAQKLGVREIARRLEPEPVDDLSRAAPQRVDEGISTDL